MKCEGIKDHFCRGEIRQHHVIDRTNPDSSYWCDWGYWWYCEEAAQIDRNEGLTVKKLGSTN
jgi:hypothetical protein